MLRRAAAAVDAVRLSVTTPGSSSRGSRLLGQVPFCQFPFCHINVLAYNGVSADYVGRNTSGQLSTVIRTLYAYMYV